MARTETHASEAEPDTVDEAPVIAAEVQRTRRWALVAAVVLLSLLAAWLISPRFEIDSPSLVDDWSAVSQAPDQVREVIRLENPEEQRFRPGWILWNYLQWHTFDAPNGMFGPNVWNLLRTVVLIGGLVLATALALPAPRTRQQALAHAALAATPALMVLAIPKFGPDVARFGPQEPLLLGGIALGGSLLVLAARALLEEPRRPAWPIVGLGVAGSLLWIVGVYQKEASLAVLPLVVATLLVARRPLGRWPMLATGQRIALIAIGAVVALPLVHVAIESARIVGRGDLAYDAEVDGGQGIWRGLRALEAWSTEVFSVQTERLMLAAVLLAAIVAILRRRIDGLVVGVLASGALTLVFAAQAGVLASRYYIPAYALAIVALVLSLARFPVVVQAASFLMLLAIAVTFLPAARHEVRGWVEEEERAVPLVRVVSQLDAEGCPVAVAGLDQERTEALPVLAGLGRRGGTGVCTWGAAYFVIHSSRSGRALAATCASNALEVLLDSYLAAVYRCSRLRSGMVRDPEFGLVASKELVELRLLRPNRTSADE